MAEQQIMVDEGGAGLINVKRKKEDMPIKRKGVPELIYKGKKSESSRYSKLQKASLPQLRQQIFQERQKQLKKQQAAIARARLKGISQGEISTAVRGMIAQQQASQKREGIIQNIGTKAERIEHFFCSINEVPFLNGLEKTRGEVCSPPSSGKLKRFEKKVTDSFPA